MNAVSQNVTEKLNLKTTEYTYLETSPIHYIRYLESSRKAVDEGLKITDIIYAEITEKDEVRFLVDYRTSGIPPVTYFMNRARQWAASLTIHPPAKMAIIHPPDPIVGITGTLINMMRFDHLRAHFFRGDDEAYDKAVAWLMEPF